MTPDNWCPLQILLVEDNLVNQQFALALLKRRGHITRVAATESRPSRPGRRIATT